MKTSWRTLNPWGILVDAVVLVAMPLIFALGGGVLASVRITLRRVMITVAVIAILLGAATAYFRRGRHYDSMGHYHRSQIASVLLGSVGPDGIIHFAPTGVDKGGKPVSEAQKRMDDRHEAMAQKYWRAARYPWITVSEDTPPSD